MMKTKLLDCTIRDGGYLNNWRFSKQLVKDLYRSISKSGVSYVEIGFRSSDKYFDPSKYGLWRFTPEEAVNEITNGVAGAEIALMVDYGKADLEDIPQAAQSKITLYRIAAHRNQILHAIEFANAVAGKGYKVALQLMGIVGYVEEDFQKILQPLRKSELTYVYFADSYGSLTPPDIKKYIHILRETNKPLGFHAHNNMQLAFSNCLEAVNNGIHILDGTVFGMGRGAGNLPIETLITYFEKSVDGAKYNVLPILELIDKYFLSLAKEFPWGHNLPYMISGVYAVHPNYATDLMTTGHYSMEDILFALQLVNKLNPIGFDKTIIPKMTKAGFIGNQNATEEILPPKNEKPSTSNTQPQGKVSYIDRHKGRDFLVLANGPSLVLNQKEISRFIKVYNPIVIGSNYLAGLFTPHYHTFSNTKRFIDSVHSVHPHSKLLLSRTFSKDFIETHTDRSYEWIEHIQDAEQHFDIREGVILNNGKAVSILSIAVAMVMGARKILIAGMDGYKDAETFLAKEMHPKGETEQVYEVPAIPSARSGSYKAQMEWHNYIDDLLKQINNYLTTRGSHELTIITPTTHKSFYKNIDSFFPKEIL